MGYKSSRGQKGKQVALDILERITNTLERHYKELKLSELFKKLGYGPP